MKRGERRYRTQLIAAKRAARYPSAWNFSGRFRKWNLTCQCSMCRIARRSGIKLQRLKDQKRNPAVEISA